MDSPPGTRSRRVTPTVAARLLQLGSAVLVVLLGSTVQVRTTAGAVLAGLASLRARRD